MSLDINLDPVYLATRRGAEDALLVLADERLVAILIRMDPETNDTGEEGWWLEVGFGPCQAEGLVFSTLPEAEDWVRAQLQRHWGQDWSSAKSPEPLVARQPPPHQLCVLVVEDDAVHALELETSLTKLGHQVVDTVATAHEAVAAAAAHRPDLVFMDVRLADGTDGIKAAIEIQRQLGIPAVFLTGHFDSTTRARIEEARPLELLAKPVSLPAIEAALQKAIQLPHMPKRLF